MNLCSSVLVKTYYEEKQCILIKYTILIYILGEKNEAEAFSKTHTVFSVMITNVLLFKCLSLEFS